MVTEQLPPPDLSTLLLGELLIEFTETSRWLARYAGKAYAGTAKAYARLARLSTELSARYEALDESLI